jgi:hypothetical protein
MNREQVGTLVLGAVVYAGTCLFSVPAKADAAAEEAAFEAKCAGYHGYRPYIRSLKRVSSAVGFRHEARFVQWKRQRRR